MFTLSFSKAAAIESMQYWHDRKGNAFKGHMQDGRWVKEKLSDEQRDSLFPHLKKTASFGDTHRDGSSFEGNSQAIDPVMYNKPTNPSANPGFDPTGGKKQNKDLALAIAQGVAKMSAQRDDIARGVVEELEKEYNGTDPVRNLDDDAAQKEANKKHMRAKMIRFSKLAKDENGEVLKAPMMADKLKDLKLSQPAGATSAAEASKPGKKMFTGFNKVVAGGRRLVRKNPKTAIGLGGLVTGAILHKAMSSKDKD